MVFNLFYVLPDSVSQYFSFEDVYIYIYSQEILICSFLFLVISLVGVLLSQPKLKIRNECRESFSGQRKKIKIIGCRGENSNGRTLSLQQSTALKYAAKFTRFQMKSCFSSVICSIGDFSKLHRIHSLLSKLGVRRISSSGLCYWDYIKECIQ